MTSSRRRRPLHRALIGLTILVLFLSVSATGGLFYLQHELTGQIDRIDGVFDGLRHRPGVPPGGHAADALNFLVVVTDRRTSVGTAGCRGGPPWAPGAQRTETLLLLHVDGNRREASVIALPPNSWVPVPGHGMGTIETAFADAGPALAVQTVEHLTGVRVHHLAVISWEGFGQLTDMVGGVTVDIAKTVVDTACGVTWVAGEHVLDGQGALDYVEQRSGLPGSDLDRMRRQQNFLRTLMEDSLHAEMRKSPRMVYDFLDVVTRNLAVDDDWSTVDMAGQLLSLRNLRTADIHYLAPPVRGLGRQDARNVAYLDTVQGAALWRAVREDRIGPWVDRHPEVEIGRAVS